MLHLEKGVMKMAKVSTNISLDSEIKKEAQLLFSDFGLDLTTAINLFLRQSIRERRIPFEITANVPNMQTREALEEYKYMKENPGEYKRYSSFNELLAEISEDA